LLAHDPQTGCATAAVAVVGIGDGGHHVSWIPYQPGAEGWRHRIATTTVDLADAVETWAELADGVASDVVELEAGRSPDMQGDVEWAVDELLATAGEEV